MTENWNDPSRRGLSAFPREILRMICENLCVHCTANLKSTKALNWEKLATPDRSLLALSQTCRVLRDIAQPIAYHTFAYIPDYAHFPKLIRTLDERPDLAAQLRWLRQHCYECGGWDYGRDEEIKLMKAVAKRLGMQRESDVDFESAEEEDTSLGKFCIELLIALASNLEWLQVYVEDDENYEGTKYYYTAERCRQMGLQTTSMPSLKKLDFVTDANWGVSASVPAIPVLLSLAPSLEHLSLSTCRGLGQEEDEYGTIFREGAGSFLRVVELQNCALEADADADSLISDIVAHAPHLEHFSYNSQAAYLGEHIDVHFSARAFLRCLRPTKHSLKFVDINLTGHSLNHGSSELVAPQSFRTFTALTTVKLDDTSFCRHRDSPDTAPTCLTDILPINVKTLVLRLYEGTGAWVDLTRLSTETDKHQHLRRVRIENILRMHSDVDQDDFSRTCEEQCDSLHGAFTESNIDFKWSETAE